MKRKANRHSGSSFKDFLEAEGLESEVFARASKRSFVHQLEKQMLLGKINKNQVRKALGSPTTTTRVFDEDYTSSSLETLTKAAIAVGCELHISLVPRKSSR
ncbi:MAG TPA: hypothetical protein PLZ57_02455 [Pseudobdellovibrionaceae bacterium]|nr:hypothetical protein [Pseudobdellovibrionaceae bacterium]